MKISKNYLFIGGLILIIIFIFLIFFVSKKRERYLPQNPFQEGKIDDPLSSIVGLFLDPASAAIWANASRTQRENIGKKIPIRRKTENIYNEGQFRDFLESLLRSEQQGLLLSNQKEYLVLREIYPIETYPEDLQRIYNTRITRLDLPLYQNQPPYYIDNQGRSISHLPNSLQELYFGNMFNFPIQIPFAPGIFMSLLPPSLKELSFGQLFDQPINLGLTPELEILKLGQNFNQILNIPPNHPLRELSYSINSVFNGNIILPLGIKNLVLPGNYSGTIDFSNFVATEKPLYIEELTLGKNPIPLSENLRIDTLFLRSFPLDPFSQEGENFINFVNNLDTQKIKIIYDEIPILNYHIDPVTKKLRAGPQEVDVENLLSLPDDILIYKILSNEEFNLFRLIYIYNNSPRGKEIIKKYFGKVVSQRGLPNMSIYKEINDPTRERDTICFMSGDKNSLDFVEELFKLIRGKDFMRVNIGNKDYIIFISDYEGDNTYPWGTIRIQNQNYSSSSPESSSSSSSSLSPISLSASNFFIPQVMSRGEEKGVILVFDSLHERYQVALNKRIFRKLANLPRPPFNIPIYSIQDRPMTIDEQFSGKINPKVFRHQIGESPDNLFRETYYFYLKNLSFECGYSAWRSIFYDIYDRYSQIQKFRKFIPPQMEEEKEREEKERDITPIDRSISQNFFDQFFNSLSTLQNHQLLNFFTTTKIDTNTGRDVLKNYSKYILPYFKFLQSDNEDEEDLKIKFINSIKRNLARYINRNDLEVLMSNLQRYINYNV